MIDSNYRGEVTAKFIIPDAREFLQNDGGYHSGDRICQMIILPYPDIEFEEVEELTETDRGNGGYGSTGR